MLFYYLILLYFNALFLMVVNSFHSVSFVNVYLPFRRGLLHFALLSGNKYKCIAVQTRRKKLPVDMNYLGNCIS